MAPAFWWLNYTRFPWLLCLAFYYAWRHELYIAVVAGFAGGLLQDLLSSFAPLGYAALCFCAGVLLVKLWSKFVDVRNTMLFAVTLACVGVLSMFVHYLVLVRKGLVEFDMLWIVFRLFSHAVLMLVCGLVTNAVMRFIDRISGEQEEEECSFEDVL